MTAVAPAHPRRAARRRGARAFTLIEMTMAMAIITLVLGACVGAIALSAKAIPDGRSRPSGVVVESKALDMFTQDAQFATGATLTSTTDVTLTMPTRRPGATSGNDTVRYYWDQNAATTPLMRQVNGGTPAVVADNVAQFALVYDRRSVVQPPMPTPGPETALASNDSANSTTSKSLTTSNSPYQSFQPGLPSNATAWNVTRVVFKARADGAATETMKVGLYATSSNQPTGSALDSTSIAEASLPASFNSVTATFAGTQNFSPGQVIAVQFSNGTGSNIAGDVQYASSSGGGLLGGLLGVVTSLLSGSNGDTLLCDIYGTVVTPQSSTIYYLTNVRATLRTGPDPNALLATSIRVVNEPQVTGP